MNNPSFARIIDNGAALELAPVSFPESPHQPTEADYNRHNFWRVSVTPPTNPAPDGFHYESSPYFYERTSDGVQTINRSYTLVADAPKPRRYDKFRLLMAMKEAGILAAFLAMLKADAELEALWNAADPIITIEADGSEIFDGAVAEVKTALQLTDEQVAALLAAAEVS